VVKVVVAVKAKSLIGQITRSDRIHRINPLYTIWGLIRANQSVKLSEKMRFAHILPETRRGARNRG
jgi:enolase